MPGLIELLLLVVVDRRSLSSHHHITSRWSNLHTYYVFHSLGLILLIYVRENGRARAHIVHAHSNDILWGVTAETEASKKKESQVSSTVSILFVVVVLLLIIIIIHRCEINIIIIHRCEIFSLALYMPPPVVVVVVRHLSMSRRHRGGKRGRKELDKIICVYVRVCVCVCLCVLVQVCACTHSSFEMKKYELVTSNQSERARERRGEGKRGEKDC